MHICSGTPCSRNTLSNMGLQCSVRLYSNPLVSTRYRLQESAIISGLLYPLFPRQPVDRPELPLQVRTPNQLLSLGGKSPLTY
jgi:hypothetical protein